MLSDSDSQFLAHSQAQIEKYYLEMAEHEPDVVTSDIRLAFNPVTFPIYAKQKLRARWLSDFGVADLLGIMSHPNLPADKQRSDYVFYGKVRRPKQVIFEILTSADIFFRRGLELLAEFAPAHIAIEARALLQDIIVTSLAKAYEEASLESPPITATPSQTLRLLQALDEIEKGHVDLWDAEDFIYKFGIKPLVQNVPLKRWLSFPKILGDPWFSCELGGDVEIQLASALVGNERYAFINVLLQWWSGTFKSLRENGTTPLHNFDAESLLDDTIKEFPKSGQEAFKRIGQFDTSAEFLFLRLLAALYRHPKSIVDLLAKAGISNLLPVEGDDNMHDPPAVIESKSFIAQPSTIWTDALILAVAAEAPEDWVKAKVVKLVAERFLRADGTYSMVCAGLFLDDVDALAQGLARYLEPALLSTVLHHWYEKSSTYFTDTPNPASSGYMDNIHSFSVEKIDVAVNSAYNALQKRRQAIVWRQLEQRVKTASLSLDIEELTKLEEDYTATLQSFYDEGRDLDALAENEQALVQQAQKYLDTLSVLKHYSDATEKADNLEKQSAELANRLAFIQSENIQMQSTVEELSAEIATMQQMLGNAYVQGYEATMRVELHLRQRIRQLMDIGQVSVEKFQKELLTNLQVDFKEKASIENVLKRVRQGRHFSDSLDFSQCVRIVTQMPEKFIRAGHHNKNSVLAALQKLLEDRNTIFHFLPYTPDDAATTVALVRSTLPQLIDSRGRI